MLPRSVKRSFLILALALGLGWHGPGAIASGREPQDEPGNTTEPRAGFAEPKLSLVTAELIAEHASVQPGGRTRIGVHFDIEEGWHIYAEDPGDAGLPTKVAWSIPQGVTISPLRWPLPEKLVDPGDIHTNGYMGSVVLLSTLKLTPSKLLPQAVPIGAHVEWLACKNICIPGKADLKLTLPVSPKPPAFSTHAQLFEHTAD